MAQRPLPALLLWLFCMLLSTPAAAAAKPDLWVMWQAADAGNERKIDHSRWQAFLDAYLHPNDDGIYRVDYAGADRAALGSYIASLTNLDPRGFNRDEQFVYWINLYNALTVEVVLRYPDKASILRMGKKLLAIGPWDDALVTITAQPVTLNDIEHRILRPIWRDHRIHYAVNCASLGCPNLSTEAYTSDNAERQLAAAETAYINHPRGVAFNSRGTLELSSIYDWYRDDFAPDRAGLLAYLARHHATLGARIASHKGRISYDYNWTLNALEPR